MELRRKKALVVFSWDRIPEKGLPLKQIEERLSKLIESNRYQIPTNRPCARPVTRVHPVASYTQQRVDSTINANLVSPYMYDTVWDAVEETESMLLHLLGHLETERGGSVVLKSATQAITQALQLYLVKYYETHGYNVRERGLLGVLYSDIPAPIILAPISMNQALEKSVEVLGIGRQSIEYYDLGTDYETDYNSVQEVVRRIHSNNKRIVGNVAVVGDTERGKIQNVTELDTLVSELCEDYDYKPPVIVDAAAQWLNAAMTQNTRNWDLSNPNIKVVVIDPQKIELPYDLSVLLLQNYSDLISLAPEMKDIQILSKEDKRKLEAQANMLTSRGGSQILAMYAYLLHEGISSLRESRERIIGLANRLADYIRESGYYKLVSEPESSVVAWTSVSNDSQANWRIAEEINNGDEDLFIAYSPIMRVRTVQDKQEYSRNKTLKYDGLHAHIMEHNTGEGIELLCRRLDEIGRKLR